jgi:hypothetical protein
VHPDPVTRVEHAAQLASTLTANASGALEHPNADGLVRGKHKAAVERHVCRDWGEDQRVELRGEYEASGTARAHRGAGTVRRHRTVDR